MWKRRGTSTLTRLKSNAKVNTSAAFVGCHMRRWVGLVTHRLPQCLASPQQSLCQLELVRPIVLANDFTRNRWATWVSWHDSHSNENQLFHCCQAPLSNLRKVGGCHTGVTLRSERLKMQYVIQFHKTLLIFEHKSQLNPPPATMFVFHFQSKFFFWPLTLNWQLEDREQQVVEFEEKVHGIRIADSDGAVNYLPSGTQEETIICQI